MAAELTMADGERDLRRAVEALQASSAATEADLGRGASLEHRARTAQATAELHGLRSAAAQLERAHADVALRLAQVEAQLAAQLQRRRREVHQRLSVLTVPVLAVLGGLALERGEVPDSRWAPLVGAPAFIFSFAVARGVLWGRSGRVSPPAAAPSSPERAQLFAAATFVGRYGLVATALALANAAWYLITDRPWGQLAAVPHPALAFLTAALWVRGATVRLRALALGCALLAILGMERWWPWGGPGELAAALELLALAWVTPLRALVDALPRWSRGLHLLLPLLASSVGGLGTAGALLVMAPAVVALSLKGQPGWLRAHAAGWAVLALALM